MLSPAMPLVQQQQLAMCSLWCLQTHNYRRHRIRPLDLTMECGPASPLYAAKGVTLSTSVPMSEPTHNQLLRRDYLLLRLDGLTNTAAKKQLGIKAKTFEDHLRAALMRDCSLADKPRPGRPPIYTSDILDEAFEWFDENDWRLLTKEELVEELKLKSILPESARVDGFYPAFKQHLLVCGYVLKWGQRSLTFALSHQHEIWREEWCLQHQAVFTSETVGDYWFCDEIWAEEAGHPKGVRAACF